MSWSICTVLLSQKIGDLKLQFDKLKQENSAILYDFL